MGSPRTVCSIGLRRRALLRGSCLALAACGWLFAGWAKAALSGAAVVEPGICYVLEIKGMTCRECAQHVQRALARVPGVADVQVDFAKGLAKVCSKPGVQLAVPNLIQAVRMAGYEAQLKR